MVHICIRVESSKILNYKIILHKNGNFTHAKCKYLFHPFSHHHIDANILIANLVTQDSQSSLTLQFNKQTFCLIFRLLKKVYRKR